MTRMRVSVWTPLLFATAAYAPAAPEAHAAPGDIDFRRDVRPILANHCFPCHGPDAQARKARLRLDTRDGALADAVVPGDLEASELYRRITADEQSERMPPVDDGHALDPAEVETLRRWIAEGAVWERHWSFIPPRRVELPPNANADWERDPLDRFVLARLEAEGLGPSPQADRATLVRRLSLDLIGLPPTLKELDAFLADEGDQAYATVVDRLLDSPHFGERMALAWLDLARYADTNGYSIDGGRHMWAFRDWVIRSYNDNKPFDEFTIEQLAGDLLPDATLDTRIASGFNRNHMTTHEGGTIAEEYRVAYVADRVKTTAQTWLGLTLNCAQCHDHKYDPISQEEYYRFFAYFNTITDRGNDGNGGKNAVPFLPVPSPADRAVAAGLRKDLAAERAELHRAAKADPSGRALWERETLAQALAGSTPELGVWSLSEPYTAASGDEAFDTVFAPERGEQDVAWTPRPDLVDGVAHTLPTQNAATYLARTITVDAAGTLELSLGSDDAIQVWHDDERVLSHRIQRGVAPDQEKVRLTLHAGENRLLLKIVNYGGPGGFYFDVVQVGPNERVKLLLARPADQRSSPERRSLDAFYRLNAEAFAPIRGRMAALRTSLEELEARAETSAMVMEEMATPRATFVLERGAYDKPGAQVEVGTPACLPPMPSDAPANRLGLARWLTDPGHPLTARVSVNGFWQLLFGVGLVETSEDFGTQGSWPSHPGLLDHLALEFVEGGWDVKALLKRIVTSATYRQDSRVTPQLRARDPRNRLLARGPRFRLQAELVRDNALAISGLLVRDVGGPSVKPYQPPGLWVEMSHFGSTPATEQVYKQGTGDDLYRRGLYTVLKRTVPAPSLAAFDAPNRELCVSRRTRTNTPLQALVVMNDPTYVEAARALARRMLIEGGDTAEERVSFGFRLATSRRPTDAELALLTRASAREIAMFAQDTAAALELLGVGDSPRDVALDPCEHAAWMVVASTLLNMSSTITRD